VFHRLWWGLSGSAGALSRYDFPSFRTSAEVPRVDIYPRLSMPLHFDGWTFRPEAAVRATWYGKSQFPAGLEQIPVGAAAQAHRGPMWRPGSIFDRRRWSGIFPRPGWKHLLGGDVRHTIEPDVSYRYVTGINNFQQILRFDETDVASNTNELEYGLTQRLFLPESPSPSMQGG